MSEVRGLFGFLAVCYYLGFTNDRAGNRTSIRTGTATVSVRTVPDIAVASCIAREVIQQEPGMP